MFRHKRVYRSFARLLVRAVFVPFNMEETMRNVAASRRDDINVCCRAIIIATATMKFIVRRLIRQKTEKTEKRKKENE